MKKANKELVRQINELIIKIERDETMELTQCLIDNVENLNQMCDLEEEEAETSRFADWVEQDMASNYLDELFFEDKR